MPMRLPLLPALALALLAATGAAWAQQTSAPPPTAPQTPTVMLDNAFKPLGDKAVTIQMIYTGEVFGNLSGGYARGADYEGLITLSLGVDLSKYLNGFSFYASGIYPHGDGISAKYVHDYNTVSNLDAFDSPRLDELWLQQAFQGGKFSIRAGLLTTDNNFFNSSNSALFINSVFGTTGVMAHDLGLPTYPVTSEGVRLYANLTPHNYVQALFVDDNPGAFWIQQIPRIAEHPGGGRHRGPGVHL
jgi:porin